MRNLLIGILVIGMWMAAFGAAPSSPTMYGPVDWQIYENPGKTASGCQANAWIRTTVMRGASTGDTTWFTKMPIEPGWEYMMSILDSVGVATDSLKITEVTYGSDGSTAMVTTAIDTLVTGATHKMVSLVTGRTIYGKSVTIHGIGIGAGQKKVTRVEVWRRRPASKQLW